MQERMLAAENMNATKQTIFWDKINLKNKSNLRWLLNEEKEKPSVFVNILQGQFMNSQNAMSQKMLFLPWMP